MFGSSRNPQIEERRAMIVGQMVQQRGDKGDLKDPASAAAVDALLAPLREPEELRTGSATLKEMDLALALAMADDPAAFFKAMARLAPHSRLTGDYALDRFLQVANRVAGEVEIEGGARKTRLTEQVAALPIRDRIRLLVLLASDAAAMLEEPYRPGALRAHLRLSVAELAARGAAGPRPGQG
jgi:hypothetical protein